MQTFHPTVKEYEAHQAGLDHRGPGPSKEQDAPEFNGIDSRQRHWSVYKKRPREKITL